MTMVSLELLNAAYNGDVAMLRKTPYIHEDITDEHVANCLHYAARSGSISALNYLLQECGFDVDKRTSFGSMALHEAAVCGQVKAVKYLLDRRPGDEDTQDLCGCTVLHLSSLYHHTALLRWLLTYTDCDVCKRTQVGALPLHCAVVGGDIDCVRYILDAAPRCIDTCMDGGITAVFLASQHGHYHIVQYLVAQKHADYTIKTTDCMTCLHAAIEAAHYECVKYLVECGLSIDDEDVDGRNALDYADATRNDAIMKYLLEKYNEVMTKRQLAMDSRLLSTRGAVKELLEYEHLLNATNEISDYSANTSSTDGSYHISPGGSDAKPKNLSLNKEKRESKRVVKAVIHQTTPTAKDRDTLPLTPVLDIKYEYTALVSTPEQEESDAFPTENGQHDYINVNEEDLEDYQKPTESVQNGDIERLNERINESPSKNSDYGYNYAKGDSGYNYAKQDSGYNYAKGDSGYNYAKADSGYNYAKADSGYNYAKADSGYNYAKQDAGYNYAKNGPGYSFAKQDLDFSKAKPKADARFEVKKGPGKSYQYARKWGGTNSAVTNGVKSKTEIGAGAKKPPVDNSNSRVTGNQSKPFVLNKVPAGKTVAGKTRKISDDKTPVTVHKLAQESKPTHKVEKSVALSQGNKSNFASKSAPTRTGGSQATKTETTKTDPIQSRLNQIQNRANAAAQGKKLTTQNSKNTSQNKPPGQNNKPNTTSTQNTKNTKSTTENNTQNKKSPTENKTQKSPTQNLVSPTQNKSESQTPSPRAEILYKCPKVISDRISVATENFEQYTDDSPMSVESAVFPPPPPEMGDLPDVVTNGLPDHTPSPPPSPPLPPPPDIVMSGDKADNRRSDSMNAMLRTEKSASLPDRHLKSTSLPVGSIPPSSPNDLIAELRSVGSSTLKRAPRKGANTTFTFTSGAGLVPTRTSEPPSALYNSVDKDKELEELDQRFNSKLFLDEVPTLDTNGRPVAEWRRQLMARQKAEQAKEEHIAQRKKENYEARFAGMPQWKRAIIEKREVP